MSISKKNSPRIGEPDVDRGFQEVYDDINEIINSVNSNIMTIGDLASGKTGDIRVVKTGEDNYRIEVRAEEGWIRPGGTDTTLVLLTDSTTGTASDTIAASGGSWDNAEINNAIASLASKINEIVEQLNNISFRLVKKNE